MSALVPAIVPWLLLGAPVDPTRPGKAGGAADWLRLVPEMKPIPELEAGSPCREDAFGREVARAAADLKGKLPDVEKQVTPGAVRSLSRWAQKEMKAYDKVPPWAGVAWKPVRADDKQGRLVLEGTVDTLPSHHPLVTRWLKAYLVYDTATKKVVRVIVTIRGQAVE
jgi:hypothetical protein